MSSDLALPREVHLRHLIQILSYLSKYHNSELVLDTSDPVIDTPLFERKDWKSSEFGHINLKEKILPKIPQPQGLGFVLQSKIDADHVADTVTRRLRNSFLIYLNSATLYWFSRKQTSVESTIFGSEFIATNQCCEYL